MRIMYSNDKEGRTKDVKKKGEEKELATMKEQRKRREILALEKNDIKVNTIKRSGITSRSTETRPPSFFFSPLLNPSIFDSN